MFGDSKILHFEIYAQSFEFAISDLPVAKNFDVEIFFVRQSTFKRWPFAKCSLASHLANFQVEQSVQSRKFSCRTSFSWTVPWQMGVLSYFLIKFA